MRQQIVRILAGVFLFLWGFAPQASAFSLSLDSIAAMGKFPRFCVNVYHWGDRFFNGYDTTYVTGTGYKFNVKNRNETWTDRYNFRLPDNIELQMSSDPCTSTGIYLTYLAVSIGYDLNVSKIFGSRDPIRNRFVFQFNCALFSAELNWVTNNVATRIKSFGDADNPVDYNIRFDGIDVDMFSVSAVYFLNHKRYSQGAAYNYSRIQRRNQGSFFVGFNYWTQDFNFNFNQLPESLRAQLPDSWEAFNYQYQANNHNYTLIVGYGYNWVFAPGWVLGISEAPTVGLKHGYINHTAKSSNSFSLLNRARMSVVWNHNHWFAGGILKVDNNLIYDKSHSLLNTVINGEISVGYRFNLW